MIYECDGCQRVALPNGDCQTCGCPAVVDGMIYTRRVRKPVTLSEHIATIVEVAIIECGSIKAAARRLGVSRTRIQRIMKRKKKQEAEAYEPLVPHLHRKRKP